jgi:phosphate transport system substrate-binding protein
MERPIKQPDMLHQGSWIPMLSKLLTWATVFLAANSHALAQGVIAQVTQTDSSLALPSYQPSQVAPPKDAGYLLPDGSIRVVGLDDMQGMIEQLNAFYTRTHPGTRFTYVKSNSLAAIYTLIFDGTAFAPAGIIYPSNLTYTDIVHGPPFSIRVAHGSLNPTAAVSPLAIIVNRSNPLDKLSMSQIGSMFTQNMRARVYTHWNQVGVTGALASTEIHPYGLPWTDHYPSEDTSFGDFFFFQKLSGAPPVDNYSVVKTYDDVVNKVSGDPSAIGVVALNHATPGVKVIAISDSGLKPPMTGTAAEIRSGQYPLDRNLYLYARVTSGKAFDPFVREYMRMVLSREGQEIIGGESHGYIPLNALEVQEELTTFQ